MVGLGVGILDLGVDVDNHIQLALEVVEHHHFVRHHQQNVRRADLVRLVQRAQARFHETHGLVAEITDQAAGKTRQAGDRRHAIPGLKSANVVERVFGVRPLDHPTVLFDGDGIALHPQQGPARQTDDRVTPPLLTALY